MATTVVLTDVVVLPDGKVIVKFSDGSANEYADIQSLKDSVLGRDVDEGLTKDLCIAYTLGRSPDLSNIASTKNKNFTFDLTQNTCIRVQ